jgi:hypothetical protein
MEENQEKEIDSVVDEPEYSIIDDEPEIIDENSNKENLNPDIDNLDSSENIKPKRKTSPSEKRVKKALYDKRIAEEEKNLLASKLSEMEQIIAQQNELLNKKNSLVESYYNSEVSTKEALLKEGIKQARLDFDLDAETELMNELINLKAEKTSYDLLKNNQAPNNYQKNDDEYDIVYPQNLYPDNFSDDDDYDDENDENSKKIKDWLSKNQWVNNNEKLSADFQKILSIHESRNELEGNYNIDPVELLELAKQDLKNLLNIDNQQKTQTQTNKTISNVYQPTYGNSGVSGGGGRMESSARNDKKIYLNREQKEALDSFRRERPDLSPEQATRVFIKSIQKFEKLEDPFKFNIMRFED